MKKQGIAFLFYHYHSKRKQIVHQQEEPKPDGKIRLTREQFISAETKYKEKPINFFDIRDLFKVSEQTGPINPIFKNKKVERKKQRVKGLSKGNEILYQDDKPEDQPELKFEAIVN